MITADTETAGFYGPVRLIGWYDGTTYQVATDVTAWWDSVRDRKEVCYFHNLDFDVRKIEAALGDAFQIAWDQCLVINGRLVRARLDGAAIELADSYALLPSSLDQLCQDFALPDALRKIHLDWAAAGYASLDDYFLRVPVDDPDYRAYLRNDVLSLYEILRQLRAFAGLPDAEFGRVPTAASLALRAFRTRWPFEYDQLCRTKLRPPLEAFFREALYGGRTEVFRTQITDGHHWDVNGLYPYVMGAYGYPDGYPIERVGVYAAEAWADFRAGRYPHGIFTATVEVPESCFIPPLPYRLNGRLTFPVGRITGTWVGEEIRRAEEAGAVVVAVTQAAVWTHSRKFFWGWAGLIADKKAHTRGAERATWKLLGNALYGKFGMDKRREQIWRDTPDNRAKAAQHDYPCTEWYAGGDFSRPYLDVLAPVFAPYVQPQIAAYITAYARLTLYDMLVRAEAQYGGAWYCDTDSVGTQDPIDPALVHPTRAGAWKHEGQVDAGLFIAPKFYAERRNGQEVLKNKGMLSSWRQTARYALYEDLYRRILEQDFDRDRHGKPILWLYRNEPALRPYVSAVKRGADPNTPASYSKAIRPLTWPKRRMDYAAGITWPWNAAELEAMEEERLRTRDAIRFERQLVRELRRRLWQGLMPRGLHDRDYPDLPRGLRRRQGDTLDVAASELGYAGPDELYRDLMRAYSR